MSLWVSGSEFSSNSTMSFAVTMPGGRWRAIKNLLGSAGCRTLIWPKASTTSVPEDLVGEHEVGKQFLGWSGKFFGSLHQAVLP